MNSIRPTIACFQLPFLLLFPTFQTGLFMSSIALFFGDYSHFFLRLKLSRGTIIAANIGQAMVNLKLYLSKSSSSHRQLHGGRALNSQSLTCEPHTLPLGYHATYVKWLFVWLLLHSYFGENAPNLVLQKLVHLFSWQ